MSEDLSDQELEKTLLKMGLITQPQLTEALEFQARIPRSEWMPLKNVLLEMEIISTQQLQEAEASIKMSEAPLSYQKPDWAEVFGPGNSSDHSQAPPPVEPVAQWDAIFNTPTSAASEDEADLKYLFDQGQAPAISNPTVKSASPPEANMPDLESLFNPGAIPKTSHANTQSSAAAESSALDLSLLFDAETAASPQPAKPTPPPPPPAAAQPTAPAPTKHTPQARPAPPPAPAPAEGGWTVQSAWGAPKKPFAPPPTPAATEFRRPIPPTPTPAPPPAAPAPTSSQQRQQELNQMLTKVMGPDALSKQAEKPLGEILLEQKELEEWQLTHALCMQKSDIYSKQKIGTILVKMGYATREEVEKALNTQINP